MTDKVFHCYIEYMNDLSGDAQKITRSLISLRNSIRKGHLEMSGYVDTTDKKLYDSITNLIGDQTNLVNKVNSYIVHSKPEDLRVS